MVFATKDACFACGAPKPRGGGGGYGGGRDRGGDRYGGRDRFDDDRGRDKYDDRGKGPSQDEIQDIVDERLEARKARDFGRADEIRDELKDMGVHVDDSDNSWVGPNGMRGGSAKGGGG